MALGRAATVAGRDHRLATGAIVVSLSWRAPMREPEPEKVPIGIPLPDMTMDQFMDLEDRIVMNCEVEPIFEKRIAGGVVTGHCRPPRAARSSPSLGSRCSSGRSSLPRGETRGSPLKWQAWPPSSLFINHDGPESDPGHGNKPLPRGDGRRAPLQPSLPGGLFPSSRSTELVRSLVRPNVVVRGPWSRLREKLHRIDQSSVDPPQERNPDEGPGERQFERCRCTIAGRVIAAVSKGVQIELGIAIEAIDEPKVAAGLMKLASLLLGYVGGARIALHDVRA
jgi:hypothetical protein